jgi:hypothetical protein
MAFSFTFQDQPRYHLLSKDAHDFLTSLEKNGTFFSWSESAQKQTDLETFIAKLPVGIGGTLTVKMYEYDSGTETFSLDSNLWATRGIAKTEKVSVNRLFINRDELYFGVATLEVWYE